MKLNNIIHYYNRYKCKTCILKSLTFIIILLTCCLYLKHWTFELPLHPNPDETIVIEAVNKLLAESLSANLPFNYPHFAFYFGYFIYKLIPDSLLHIFCLPLCLRIIICGTALISNVFVYLSLKKLTQSEFWGMVGFIISICSLYQFGYLYYASVDSMLYAVSNVYYFIICWLFVEKNEKKCNILYILSGIVLGLAISSKYHGGILCTLLLFIHYGKSWYNRTDKNLLLIISFLFTAFIYIFINVKMLYDFDNFIKGFVFNFRHYAGRHIGIEHNLPSLGYFESWVLNHFGIIGLLFFILGLIYRSKKIDQKILDFAFITLSLLTLIILGRYRICLGRNIVIIIPITYIYMTYGIIKIYDCMSNKIYKIPATVNIVLFMVSMNIFTMISFVTRCESYTVIEQWINNNIPMGSTIYIDRSYAPYIDEKYYTKKIIKKLPEKLLYNEFYITSGYWFDRFVQQNNFYITQNGFMYPDLAHNYIKKTSKLFLIFQAKGITYQHDWRYKTNYIDIFKSRVAYCQGPSIKIYKGK